MPFDLVLLEVGAFLPAWGDIHLGFVHALQVWQMLSGGVFLPVHPGTFSLATHAAGRDADGACAGARRAAADASARVASTAGEALLLV